MSGVLCKRLLCVRGLLIAIYRPIAATSKRPDGWHSSLREGNADSSDNEELRPFPAPSPLSTPVKPKGPREPVSGQQERTDSFSWLLNSDDSQSRPDSPPNYFYQSFDD